MNKETSKIGRPLLYDEKMTKYLVVRISEEQHNLLMLNAKYKKQKVGTYVRSCLFDN